MIPHIKTDNMVIINVGMLNIPQLTKTKYLTAQKKTRFIECEINGDGCWVVISHKPTTNGYIQICRKRNFRLFRYSLHRLIYATYNGVIPPNMIVCHSCDNPRCINPDHLWIGSHRDNTQDSIKKGRFRKIKKEQA